MIEEIFQSTATGIWILTFYWLLCFWVQKKSDRKIGVLTKEESEECLKKMKEIDEWLESTRKTPAERYLELYGDDYEKRRKKKQAAKSDG